ncbi:MAG: 6-bladed beta-propeller [Candidatus Latescibacterota bacterium]
MKCLPFAIMVLLLCSAFGPANAADVPRTIDNDGPTQGVQPLALHELWRVGGEDEDIMFGRITDLKMHPDGSLYVLDNQLCQVVVISADGEHLRDISREGDGPGEVRRSIPTTLSARPPRAMSPL